MFLYRVHTKSICYPERKWLKEIKSKHLCSKCNKINFKTFSDGIDVVLRDLPDKSAINSIMPPGINIAKIEFLNIFNLEIKNYLLLGNVYTSKGKILTECVTFVGNNKLLLRGSEDSIFRGVCHACNRLHYYPKYPWYVLKDQFLDQPIFESYPLRGLIITEDICTRIDKSKWKGIYITKLPVVDEPKDGIDLPNVDPIQVG